MKTNNSSEWPKKIGKSYPEENYPLSGGKLSGGKNHYPEESSLSGGKTLYGGNGKLSGGKKKIIFSSNKSLFSFQYNYNNSWLIKKFVFVRVLEKYGKGKTGESFLEKVAK